MNEKRSSPPQSLVRLSLETFNLLSPRQRRQMVNNIVSSIVQAALEVVSLAAIIPLFFKLIGNSGNSTLDNFLAPLESLSWPLTLVLIVLIFLTKNLISLWLTRYQSQFVHEIFTAFSEQLYHRFYHQQWGDYLRENSAETVRKIKHTPSDFTNYVLQGYLMLITDAVICVLMGGILVWYDYRIVLVIAVLSAPIILFYYWFRKNVLAQMNNSFREITPKANVILVQGIDSFAETKIYQKENFFISHFMTFNRLTSQYLASLKLATNLPARLFEMVGILCFTAVIIYSKFYPTYEDNLLVLLGLFSIAMYRMIPSLNRMLISLSQIQAYAYSVGELNESFASTTKESVLGDEALPFQKNIQFKNVFFRYRDSSDDFLFQNLSITINKGDFLILEGPSGVGKTTLIHLLTGLMSNYDGEILIDGRKLSSGTMRAWQAKLGFVPQAAIVLQGTIVHNVAFGVEDHEINKQHVKRALQLAGLYDFVSSMPFQEKTPVGENGLTLSGGQRQRLILARALYRNPEVLLLDEVTNQLDEENKRKILATLKELSQKGTTIILASHDPVVRSFSNRILHLKDKVIREVPVAESSAV